MCKIANFKILLIALQLISNALKVLSIILTICLLISCSSRVPLKKNVMISSFSDSLSENSDSTNILTGISEAAKARVIKKIRERIILINLIEKFDSIDHTGQSESETLPYENDDQNGYRDWTREMFYYQKELKMVLESSKSVTYPYNLKCTSWKKDYYWHKQLLYRYIQNTNFIYSTDTGRASYLKNVLGMKCRFEATEQREYFDKNNLVECLCKTYRSELETNPTNLFDTIKNTRCRN